MSNGSSFEPDYELKKIIDGLTHAVLASPEHILAAVVLSVGRDLRKELEHIRFELQNARADNSNFKNSVMSSISMMASGLTNIASQLSNISYDIHKKVEGE
jgi:hypothetical protein